MSVLLSGLQNRVKNSAAYAAELGLMLIANGEELPYLLSPQGEQISAGLSAPAAAPTVADLGTGNLPNGKFLAYAITYVSENTFPLVAAIIQSLPSPLSAIYDITGTGNREVTVSFTGSDDPLITSVYLYRTDPQTTSDLALIAAQAGLLNFVGKIANATGSLSLVDNTASVIGNDPIDYTPLGVPQFRFVVWDGSYFWGFGNQPFNASATWATDGTISLNDPSTDQFYGGRNSQFITFDGVSTGGIDGRGTYLFKQVTSSTGQAILEDGSNATLPSTTSGMIVIVGQTATLYRSAFRNPFSWGYLQNLAGDFIPSLWQLKVSGSMGTAIAIIPDQQLLKLDMEFPALCVTYALQTSDTDTFSTTQRQVSRLYSVTSHFSQFFAVSQGRQVLWGMDFKNLAIVECNGYTQVPISAPVSILLRQLSKNRSLHLLAHGTYDPVTEINAIWLPSIASDIPGAPYKFDLCVYQHAPTGFWGVFSDYGILSSAPIEDPNTSERSILVGAENGFLGKAFDVNTNGNFLPTNSLLSGYIRSATPTTITRADGQDDFNPLDAGLIGNYCIIVDAEGLNPQIVQITAVTSDTLTFAQTLSPIPPTTDEVGQAGQFENGLFVSSQAQFFIGLIELRMLKYFNDGMPSIDKAPREYWATLADANNPQVEFYPEHTQVPTKAVQLQQDTILDAWFNKLDFPTPKKKSYGLALVERSYSPTKFFDFTLK